MSFLLLTRAVLDFTRFLEAKLNKYKIEWPIVYFGDKLLILASFGAFFLLRQVTHREIRFLAFLSYLENKLI